MRLAFANRGRAVVEEVGKQLAQPFRAEQPLLHGRDDGAFQHLVADADAGTGAITGAEPAPATVISVPAAFAGGDHKALTTFGVTAARDAGEHRRPGDDPGRGDPAGVTGNAGLDLEPFLLGDDHGRGHLLPFVLGTPGALARVVDAVEVDAAIGAAGQDLAKVRDVELLPA